MIIKGDETLSRWMRIGAIAFSAVALLAAIALHGSFAIPWVEAAVAGIAVVAIQVAFFAAMFYARQFARRTRDLRWPTVVSGLYLIMLMPTGFYFAWRWHLVSSERAIQDGTGITICVVLSTAIGIIIFSFWRPR